MIRCYFQNNASPLLNSQTIKKATKARQAILDFFMELHKVMLQSSCKMFQSS